MRFLLILGSLRKGSYNKKIVQYMVDNFSDSYDFEVVDVDLPIFNQDYDDCPPTKVLAMKEAIKRADGVIIVSPEYNHSVPGPVKNAIDWMSRAERPLVGKPVTLMGASDGNVGTARNVKEIKSVLQAPGVAANVYMYNHVLVGNADEKVGEDGKFNDPRTEEYLVTVLEKFSNFVDKNKA